VKIGMRNDEMWTTVPRAAMQPEPTHLDELKEMVRRSGVVSLLDVLTEADWLTGLRTEFTKVAAHDQLDGGELRRQLLLVLRSPVPGRLRRN
jgi:hypothetical protein